MDGWIDLTWANVNETELRIVAEIAALGGRGRRAIAFTEPLVDRVWGPITFEVGS